MPVLRRSARISSLAKSAETLDRELRLKILAHIPAASLNGHARDIAVEVKDGFVKLSGVVRTFHEKERLRRFVMGLRGVRALKDLVRVNPLESLADRQVALLVRQALDARSELPPGTITVHVQGGICTVHGHVRTAEESMITEKVSRHCRGVKEVLNELTVDPLDEVSDEAPSILDRSLAEEVTRIQNGVRAVENHIQVATHAKLDPITVCDNTRRNTRRLTKASVRRSQRR